MPKTGLAATPAEVSTPAADDDRKSLRISQLKICASPVDDGYSKQQTDVSSAPAGHSLMHVGRRQWLAKSNRGSI